MVNSVKLCQAYVKADTAKAYSNESIKQPKPPISFKSETAPKDYNPRKQYYSESSGFEKGSLGHVAYTQSRSEGQGKIASFFGGLAEAFKYFN